MVTTARPDLVPPAERRQARPVLWWAGAGVVLVALQLYVYTSWIASDDFRKVPTGEDPVPQWEKAWAWILQSVFAAVALAAVVWVVRGCLRERRLTFDGKIFLACLSILWLDPIGNYVSPQIFFNSYYLNRGSWVEHIPGWISRDGANLPNNLIELCTYTFMIFVIVGANGFMRWLRRTRPRMGNVGLLVWTWLAMALFIIVLEWPVLIRTGFASWGGAVHELTLFSDSRYQMPVVVPDPALWGAALTFLAALRFFRDDHGRSLVERGLGRVGQRFRTVVSTFAVVGAANLAMLLYGFAWASLAVWLDDTPDNLPSYILNDMCGPGTDIECPGPDVPIVLSGR